MAEDSNKAQHSVALMNINATKAGMDGLDKDAINAIIEQASRGSKFFDAKAKAQKRIDAKIESMKSKMNSLSEEAIEVARIKADKLFQEIKSSAEINDNSKVIVHVDMDAFYAAVEERDQPSLKDQPMAVGGMGMLSTSNYLARKYGVRAGMPGFIGKKLCPTLKIVPPNFEKYKAVSSIIRQVFKEYDPGFCPMSLDEAYLDITEYLDTHSNLRASEVVEEMRAKIFQNTQLTASAGISLNTMLAKICSDLNKPNGQYELLNPEEAKSFISKTKIRKVCGIGNVTEQLLSVTGVDTCQNILERRGLIFLLFSENSAQFFFGLALGLGSTKISEMSNRERKSMSTETTFRDTSDVQKLREICDNLSNELAYDLQASATIGRQITVKIKTDTFAIKTRVANLFQATHDVEVIKQTASKILNYFIENNHQNGDADKKPLTLRLLGIRMSELQNESQLYSSSSAQDQSTIDSFFNTGSDTSTAFLKTYKCPLCNTNIQARSETSFNTKHFEKCLKNISNDDHQESQNFPHKSTNSNNKRPAYSTDDAGIDGEIALSKFKSTGKPPEKSVNSKEQAEMPDNDDVPAFKDSITTNPEISHANSSSSIQDTEKSRIRCPICESDIVAGNNNINSHIDLCLNKSLIREVTSSSVNNPDVHSVILPSDRHRKRKCNLPVDESNKKPKSIKSYFVPTAMKRRFFL